MRDRDEIIGSLIMLFSLFAGNFYEVKEGDLIDPQSKIFTGYQLIFEGASFWALFLVFIPLTILLISIFLGKINPVIYITLVFMAINLVFVAKSDYLNLMNSVNKITFSTGARIFLIGAGYIIFKNFKSILNLANSAK
ncbi:MAG: hypothetical protein ABF804_11350 [Liquorilactobacillus ghanensis]|uniref:hypothetical protein n=1 Tax=Liquorilactobacillus ghanensis TaxID=399370 RepID=UPI0039EC380C